MSGQARNNWARRQAATAPFLTEQARQSIYSHVRLDLEISEGSQHAAKALVDTRRGMHATRDALVETLDRFFVIQVDDGRCSCGRSGGAAKHPRSLACSGPLSSTRVGTWQQPSVRTEQEEAQAWKVSSPVRRVR